MNKVKLIIAREYLTRVKKLSFVVMTILGPLLMAALIIVPFYVANKSQKTVRIMVVDENDFFINAFTDTRKNIFSYRSGDFEQIKNESIQSGKYDAVLHILQSNYSLKSNLYFSKDLPMNVRSSLESQMDKLFFDKVLRDTFHIDPQKFEMIKNSTRSNITMIQTDEQGKEMKNFSSLNRVLGIIFGFAIYFFIFMFASQVLRSVLEEKTNRIVEVLLSSVKPLQLMLGKIIAVAMVGLTQFALWIIFTVAIVFAVQIVNPDFFSGDQMAMEMTSQMSSPQIVENTEIITAFQQGKGVGEVLSDFYGISFSQIILSFLFYFLFGYLLYAALFAAIGSAVDNEADSNQFTLPVTVPLILTIILIMPMADDPNGSLAWWLSMIPLTSPIAMLVRLPSSGVPLWELLLSMGIMVLFFMLCLWLAAKIYRTGILMYGKKVSYKELIKWLKY